MRRAVIAIITLLSLSPLQAQDDEQDLTRPPMTLELYNTILEEAKGGEPNAQNTLGSAHRTGWGVVRQDYPMSSWWYRFAAEQGHAFAQGALGIAYSIGRGVPEDPVQAHKWLNLAASRMSGGDGFEAAKEARDLLADDMSVAQLNAARQLAEEWQPSTWADLTDTDMSSRAIDRWFLRETLKLPPIHDTQ